jgi:glycosyltransferase involved in cell wall biosynthesis
VEKKNCRILLFSDTVCDANGVSRFLQNFSHLANELDIDFRVVTSTKKKRCDDRLFINTPPLIRFRMPFYKDQDLVIPRYGKLLKIAREFKPDLIHLSTPGFIGLTGSVVAKKLNIPVAGVYHTDFPQFIYDNVKVGFIRTITEKILIRFYKNFSAVFSRSASYIPHISESIKVPKEKILVLQAGIDTTSFHKKFAKREIWENFPEIDRDSVKALYVGRLTKEKNFPLLIQIWRGYREKFEKQNSALIVIGDGKELYPAEELKEVGVYFLGYRGGVELSTIYASSDIFLFPSVNDTLGQSVMEAQSSGLPVLVSKVGGPQTVINLAGESGFALDTEDPEAWIEKIGELAGDSQLRQELGESGHNAIQKMSIKESFLDFIEKSCRAVGK